MNMLMIRTMLTLWCIGLSTGYLLQDLPSCHRFRGESQLQALPSIKQLQQPDFPVDFHVAPMQCYTNLALRNMFRELSPDAMLWTEMEKVPDLLAADSAALERRFGPPGRKETVLQLGGNDPLKIGECIKHLSVHDYSFREINLNCGCPSIESGGASTFGASLMKQPELTRDLISTMQAASRKWDTRLSLKCRIATFDTPQEISETGYSDEQCEQLYRYVQHAQEGGISHLILHARAAVLSGLSPSKNRQVPLLDYSIVERVAKDFPIDVTLNGGISGISQFNGLIKDSANTGVSSFMAGRWILRRPLDLIFVQHCIDGRVASVDSSASSVAVQAVDRYGSFIRQSMEISKSRQSCMPTLDAMILPLFMVSEQLREDYNNDGDEDNGSSLMHLGYEDMEDIYDTICETVQWLEEDRRSKLTNFSPSSIEFNKLNSAFKSLVGTKVANKWKRDRAEL